jgi:hypothetical protein
LFLKIAHARFERCDAVPERCDLGHHCLEFRTFRGRGVRAARIPLNFTKRCGNARVANSKASELVRCMEAVRNDRAASVRVGEVNDQAAFDKRRENLVKGIE